MQKKCCRLDTCICIKKEGHCKNALDCNSICSSELNDSNVNTWARRICYLLLSSFNSGEVTVLFVA